MTVAPDDSTHQVSAKLNLEMHAGLLESSQHLWAGSPLKPVLELSKLKLIEQVFLLITQAVCNSQASAQVTYLQTQKP